MNATALAKVDGDEPCALARTDEGGGEVEELLSRFHKIREVQRRAMVEGVHYGKVPGTDKPALLKPGAEMLCLLFHLDPQFSTVERWDGEHLECVVTCTLFNAQTEKRLGSGIGSCSTKESKYAWRKSERECPKCGKAAIIKGNAQYGGGWLCWKKKDGCGAKFGDNDAAIEGQKTGRVPNPDLPDMYNTVRKMACKRAHVAASLFVTGGSALFTQDAEDAADGADERPPTVSPHGHAEDDNGAGSDAVAFTEFLGTLEGLERDTDSCASYDKALALRERLGSKAKPSPLTLAMQRAGETSQLSAEQRRELGKIWQRVNRKLEKHEKSLAPDVAASFSDADEDAPAEDTGELSEEDERRLF